MGTPFQVAWPSIWDDIKPVFDGAETTKKAVDVVEIPLMVERLGFLEEAYFTGNFVPIRGDRGKVEGFYNAHDECTRQKINDRRQVMLRAVSEPSEKHTISTIGQHIITSLETNPRDIPFALLYQLDENPLTAAKPTVFLSGSIGLPSRDHKLAIQRATLDSDLGLIPLLRSAQSSAVTIAVDENFEGIAWKGFSKPSTHITAAPLRDAGRLLGFLVIGANPCRPVDRDHNTLVRELAKHLSATIGITITAEQAARREQRLADSERHIQYMAKHLDIGMEHLTLDGEIMWANEHFWTLIDEDPADMSGQKMPFLQTVIPEDRSKVLGAWERVKSGLRVPPMELRIRRMFQPPAGGPVHATLLLSSFPYLENDETKFIMACMTDVSRLKWAEAWQARAAHDAHEAKRQQSEFTDAISHEVRNPLSAIFQLADSIKSCLDEAAVPAHDADTYLQLLQENIEAANTILVCANHQKRLVDDVLTMSKMDFTISLSPTATKPPDLVGGALKILEADLAAAAVELEIVVEPSMADLEVGHVLCDSLRVTQIIINLLSNAIKFTKRETYRKITLTYGVSLSDPKVTLPQDIVWATTKREYNDVTLGQEWGGGQVLYLTFLIKDTGPGMTKDELQRLFNRFEQATPRTSIKYGGSGLGLFISHSLAEKQCGRIGVSSIPGQGSTFAFYIKGRRDSSSVFEQSRAQEEYGFKIDAMEARPVRFPDSPSEELLSELQSLSLVSSIPSPPPSSGPGSGTKARYHIMLVEDNIVNQRILRKQLMKAGCVVYVANHGLEALELLRTTDHWVGQSGTGKALDVILMDWEMPVCDGLTACREIRKLEGDGQIAKKTEVIAVTANVRKEQVEMAMAAGMDGVISKPFVILDLLETIKQHLGR